MTFQRGVVQEARFQDQKGDAALQALLTRPSEAVWGFSFVDQSIIPSAAPVGAFEFVLDVSPTGEVFELLDVAHDESKPEGPPPRLLLVDDDPSLLTMYGKFLERSGFEVHTARNGQHGYSEALRLLPDIILSDIMMPETDGWGFLTLVRDDFRLRETPFMLLSCQVNFVEKLRDLEAGADDYLEKGMRGEAVVQRVTDLLEPRRKMIAQLDPSSAFQGNTGMLGLQTLLMALGNKGASGTLHVSDGLVRYALGMVEGRLVTTTAASNGRVSHGREALLSVLGIDDAPFAFLPSEVPPAGPGPRFTEMRQAVCAELNQARDNLRERMLSGDSKLTFHPSMSTFYRMVSPEVVQAIMDALADGNAPREVMASGIASPVLVDWVVKDMLRKGVARFA
ncbi:MAG: response regulator [Myxococcota bacterium]